MKTEVKNKYFACNNFKFRNTNTLNNLRYD